MASAAHQSEYINVIGGCGGSRICVSTTNLIRYRFSLLISWFWPRLPTHTIIRVQCPAATPSISADSKLSKLAIPQYQAQGFARRWGTWTLPHLQCDYTAFDGTWDSIGCCCASSNCMTFVLRKAVRWHNYDTFSRQCNCSGEEWSWRDSTASHSHSVTRPDGAVQLGWHIEH